MNIYKYGKNLRCGYTTGACSAAAAKAAADMLLNDRLVECIELTLKGSMVSFDVEDITCGADSAKCAVRKDAGADIDVTDGLLIYADVQRAPTGSRASAAASAASITNSMPTSADPPLQEPGRVGMPAPTDNRIIIKGGPGVGIVTKAGLDQPPGTSAINSGPRRMITEAVLQICDEADYDGTLTVTISVPGGAEIAEKTFNPVLGIQGGISILGSTGIVEPMSEPALIETIRAEMRVKWLELNAYDESEQKNNACRIKQNAIVIVPGNYGMKFAVEKLGADEGQIVKCSNFIGESLDYACELGISELVIAGNLGKLIKLAGGIFNTHSRNADCRMDILMRCAFTAASELLDDTQNGENTANEQESHCEIKNSTAAICRLMADLNSCVTTDAALEVLKEAGAAITGGERCIDMLDATMRVVAEKASEYIKRRCAGSENRSLCIRLFIISNDMDILSENMIYF